MADRVKRPYIYALDFVRMATIVGVVCVHSVRFGLVPSAPVAGGLLQMALQFGRESFMVMTGLVLTYQYIDRKPEWLKFWRRRYGALLPPYLVWLAFFVALSFPLWPVLPYLERFVRVLPTGNGHLYYVVLTMELYVVTPLFMALVRLARRHPVVIGAAAVAWELVLWTLSGYLGWHWVAPQMLVWTYGGYFTLGGILAVHWPAVRDWLSARRGQTLWFWAAGCALLAVGYGADYAWTRNLGLATTVFQPVSVIYSVAVIAALFAGGTWFEATRVIDSRWDRLVRLLGNASFGIYLISPIFLHGWLTVTHGTALGRLPWINTVFTAAVTLVASTAAVYWLQTKPRLTWLVGQPRTAVKPPLGEVGGVAERHVG